MSEQKHFDDVFQKPEPNSEFSSHGRGDSHWLHAAEKTKTSVLGFAVALTLSFSVIELVGGLWGNSLALIGDAGHMVTDSASLLFALVANKIAQKGADDDHSFGHGRVEVLAAFINGLVMLCVVGWIFFEAVSRIMTPEPVSGLSVMAIAAVGLVINILVAWSLSRDRKNMNTRAALLHVMGDLLGSVAAPSSTSAVRRLPTRFSRSSSAACFCMQPGRSSATRRAFFLTACLKASTISASVARSRLSQASTACTTCTSGR